MRTLGLAVRVTTPVVLLLACAALPAAAAEAPVGEGALRGLVFDEATGAPAADVRVWIPDHAEICTDENGAFRFLLPPGEYRLELVGADLPWVRTAAIPVLRGEVTEVVLTLHHDARDAWVDVEAADQGRSRDDAGTAASGPLGRIRGQAVHEETGEPVSGARVFVRGLPVEAQSAPDGWFEVAVPAGTHDLTVIHPDFSTLNQTGLEVRAHEATLTRCVLLPAVATLDAFVVSAPRIEGGTVALMDERRESGAVADVIGAEQMSKAGDSDAAGALKRVTGVTVVGGKYVYIRGLGERYSSTTLNGSTLPSPEPERRVVPLDLFPVDLLESVVIQKTYTPDMPGEFGGGVVQLRTRGFPQEFTASVSASVGALVGTTFEDGLMYDGGSTDWLGIDGRSRSLPPSVEAESDRNPLKPQDMITGRGVPIEKLELYGEMVKNQWTPYRDMAIPNLGLAGTVGHGFEIADKPAGFLFSLTYGNDWQKIERHVDYLTAGTGGKAEIQHGYDFERLTNNVSLGGILDMGIDLAEDQQLRLSTVVVRISEDEARIYEGRNRDVGTDIRVTRLRWIEQMLLAQQAHGHHVVPQLLDLEVDWRYTFSMATRLEPDRRETRYDRERGDLWLLSDRPEASQRVFSELQDFNHDVGLDLTLPFEQWEQELAKVKLGVTTVFKDREVDTRRYKFVNQGPLSGDTDIISQRAEDIFVPEVIGPQGFLFMEITRPTDNYTAGQQLVGAYAMTDLPLGAGFRVVGGLRVEHSIQEVETFQLFNPDGVPETADLTATDALPAATLTWEFITDMLVRLGYSRTLNRPDFRELSPATFNDVTGGRQVFGNPDLERATLDNVDLRWEWYLGPGESVSVAGFYKHFTKPIESVVVPSAQLSVTYANAEGADNVGGEIEFRKSFGWIHDLLDDAGYGGPASAWLADLYIAGNATYVYSRVSIDPDAGEQTSSERPLQGQSPYVFNLQLAYENVDIGTGVTLLYNVFGERIIEVGAKNLPDAYEQPFHQLDLVIKQELGAGFKLSFKAKNLVDSEIKLTQGDFTTEKYRKGRAFSLSLGWSY